MELPIFQLDAFAAAPFRGNPAAVVPLEYWLEDALLQAIAAENNLPETAFYVRGAEGYRIRWFTPTQEVDLCGNATLAAAAVILQQSGGEIVFQSRSGPLKVARTGELYTLDFPRLAPQPAPEPDGLFAGLGARPVAFLRSNYCVCVFETEEQVRALRPDMSALAKVDCFGTIATAVGLECDFVSRMFAPGAGIPEDAVTGSAHSALIPYWSQRLGKRALFARQISARGGELWCEDRGTRVGIGGKVVKFLEGMIWVTG